MVNKNKSHSISIRLHNTDVKKYEDVLKLQYQKEGKTLVKVIAIPKSIGNGKVFALTNQSSTPTWKSEVEELTGNRIKIPDNTYSKVVIVVKLKDRSRKDRFLSISYGYGESLLDNSKFVTDFGKLVAAKKVSPDKVSSAKTMQVKEDITQNQKQNVGVSSQGIKGLVKSSSEFLTSVSGYFSRGPTETKLTGSNELLRAKRSMPLTEVINDLQYYLDEYLDKKIKIKIASNLSQVKPKKTKDELDQKLAEAIINDKLDFGVAWPGYEEIDNLTVINLLGKGIKPNLEPVQQLRQYIIQKKPTCKTFLNKLQTARIVITKNQAEQSDLQLYKCLFAEISGKNGFYLLYNGVWYTVDNNFYNEMWQNFKSVPVSPLKLPAIKKGETETAYNKRAASEIDAKELHLSTYKSTIGRRTIEPADIVTPNREFLYVKKGLSSAMLSHLFEQAAVAADLLSQHVDPKFRKKILSETNFSEEFLDNEVPNSQITIVFVIIRKTKTLPFFSILSFVDTVKHLRIMSFKVQIAWVSYY